MGDQGGTDEREMLDERMDGGTGVTVAKNPGIGWGWWWW